MSYRSDKFTKKNLSVLQKKVVAALNDGGHLMTSGDEKGATVITSNGRHFHINGKTFWNMVHKGVISQELQRPFDYKLTPNFK
jgi:hypothetical protein